MPSCGKDFEFSKEGPWLQRIIVLIKERDHDFLVRLEVSGLVGGGEWAAFHSNGSHVRYVVIQINDEIGEAKHESIEIKRSPPWCHRTGMLFAFCWGGTCGEI
jgi:hypothetical protein